MGMGNDYKSEWQSFGHASKRLERHFCSGGKKKLPEQAMMG
jgi:hypothetical protein